MASHVFLYFIPVVLASMFLHVTGSRVLGESRRLLPAVCTGSRDVFHGGLRVDCTDTGITSKDLKNMVSEEVTTLILDSNPIQTLYNSSFQGFTYLVVLSLTNCQLHQIELHAFQGLRHLIELNLQNNYLRFQEWSLPFAVFDMASSIETLSLHYNLYYKDNKTYSESLNIFNSLKNLSSLSFDSFPTINVGYEFAELRKLYKLFFNCKNVLNVFNNSLDGLQNSTVKQLILDGATYIFFKDFETSVFKPLPDLDLLSLNSFRVGNKKIMEAMEGLENKTITTLAFNNINQLDRNIASPYANLLDSYIKAEETNSLAKVCVHHLKWTTSGLLGIEVDKLVNDLWRRCLLSFDFSQNYLIKGFRSFILNILRLSNLQTITTSSSQTYPAEYPPFWYDILESFHGPQEAAPQSLPFIVSLPRFFPQKTFLNRSDVDSNSWRSKSYNNTRSSHCHREFHEMDIDKTFMSSAFKPYRKSMSITNANEGENHIQNQSTGRFVIYLPQCFIALRADNLHELNVNSDIEFRNGDAVRDIYIRYSLRQIYFQRLFGINGVKRLDFRGSDFALNENVFQFFPNMTKLVLRQTQTSPEFLHTRADSLLCHNRQLEYLDLSHNGLNRLPGGTFLTNSRLRYLCLAFNRFTEIPFDLTLTPVLEILDLRNNSFTSLTQQEQHDMEAHRFRVPNFTVLLAGNALVCTCSTRPFSLWLRSTAVRLDQGGNYSCSTEAGGHSHMLMKTTAEEDLRRCEGKFFLMLCLTVLGVITALYTAAFFSSRYQKLVVSKILLLLAPGFRILSQKDFDYDVFIGYADSDVLFVRYRLLPLLEQWKLERTFVHHRDLHQDWMGLSQAVRDSWRCLLILSGDFLQHTDMAHYIMKNAVFFVSAENLKKLVLLVEERNQYSVPDYVLQVTEEENIIVVPDLTMPMPPDALETLRYRLTT